MWALGSLKATGVVASLVVIASATAVASVPRSTTEAVAQERAAITDAAEATANLPAILPGPDTLTATAADYKSARHQQTVGPDEPKNAKAAKKKAKKKSAKSEAPPTNTGPIPTATSPKSGRIQALVKKHFPASQLGNAMAVAACESGHSDAVGAVNNDGTVDWGVFQLNDGGTLQGSLSAIGVSYGSKAQAQKIALDTETNVKAAASIYASRGWAPWVCAYKIRIVASLYGNSPGPMNGKFDDWGKPTVSVPTVPVGPAPARKTPSDTAKPTKPPTKSPSASPKPSKSPKPTSPTAAPRNSAPPAPTPSASKPSDRTPTQAPAQPVPATSQQPAEATPSLP
ncbi:MAG: hypothetical protein K0U64_05565 [Actinomycetia bacterium]|nr:hypothetical protein [Actinomycetes bacterium]